MEFFNKLGNIASETYKKTSKKTGDLAKEAKIRMKMNEDKGKIKDFSALKSLKIVQKYRTITQTFTFYFIKCRQNLLYMLQSLYRIK